MYLMFYIICIAVSILLNKLCYYININSDPAAIEHQGVLPSCELPSSNACRILGLFPLSLSTVYLYFICKFSNE